MFPDRQLGLVISLALLLFKFIQEVFHFLPTVFEMKEPT